MTSRNAGNVQSVYILRGSRYRGNFYKNLEKCLQILDAQPVYMTEWTKFKQVSERLSKKPCLLLVEAFSGGVPKSDLVEFFSNGVLPREHKLVLIIPKKKFTWSLTLRGIPPHGVLGHAYSTVEIAFVIRPLLFPVKSDRRAHQRVLARVPVDFRVGYSGSWRRGKLFDLSVDGLFIQSEETVPSRSYVGLKLHLPDGKDPIVCYGRTVASRLARSDILRPTGFAVSLRDATKVDQFRIQDFVHERIALG